MNSKQIEQLLLKHDKTIEKFVETTEHLSDIRKDMNEMKVMINKLQPVIEFMQFTSIGKKGLMFLAGVLASIGAIILFFRKFFT